jgi:hypothetical protein
MAKKLKYAINYYSDKSIQVIPIGCQKFAVLSAMMGVNTYWWDAMQNPNKPDDASQIYLPKFNRIKDLNITRIRFYIDQKGAQPLQNQYALNPNFGGWFSDDFMKAFKAAGIISLPDIMNNPDFIIKSWVDAGLFKDYEANSIPPYLYEDRDKRELPYIWRFAARMAFVGAARWGKNKNIDPASIQMWQNTGNIDPTMNKSWQKQDISLVGQDITDRQENENEVDGNWRKAPYGYLNGREMAALCSAKYDGHKGTLGAGYGIKTADPNYKMVMNGLATADPKLLKAFYDWIVENRGYKADGKLDVPFDIINYHKYSTDGDLQQWGNSTTGMPPELSGVLTIAERFVAMSDQYLNGLPVIITEWGNDLHPQSPFRAPAIGTLTADLVQAAWYIRTIIGYQARKIQELYVFQLFANKAGSPQQFDTMYLLNNDDPVYTRTIAADYMKQFAAEFGNYSQVVQISSDPIVYKYSLTGKPDVYCLWKVEASALDAAGNTQLTEQTLNYTLPLAGKTSVQLYTLTPKSDQMAKVSVNIVNGVLPLQLRLTPIFVVV